MPDEPQASWEAMGRRHFHWCLAAIIVPVLSLPLEWLLAYGHGRVSQTVPEHRRWFRWFVGLALIDTFLAVLVVALIGSGVWGWHTLTERRGEPRPADSLRIGVTVVPNPERPDEAQIGRVADDSPAKRAGLQPGDVLLSIDGEAIRKVNDPPAMIRSGSPGVPRTIRVMRAGHEAEFTVTPERRPAIRHQDRALFDAMPTPSCLSDSVGYARATLQWRGLWAAGLLMVLFWLFGRFMRGGAPALSVWVVAGLGSAVLAGSLTLFGVCLGGGGRSAGAVLLARLAQAIAVLIVGLVAMRHMTARGLLTARLEPVLGAGWAVALGFFYVGMINARLDIVATAVDAFTDVHLPGGAVGRNVTNELASLGWPGAVLVILTVAVVGPIEEEVLFRGVVLPRLASWMGAAWAIVATSAVFSVLHEGFGDEPFGTRTASVFVIALALGWARLRSGGLVAPITMHIATNALCLLYFGRA